MKQNLRGRESSMGSGPTFGHRVLHRCSFFLGGAHSHGRSPITAGLFDVATNDGVDHGVPASLHGWIGKEMLLWCR